MLLQDRLKLFIFILILSLLFVALAYAETKVFEKEVEEIVGRDQSQEQVEAFALQKAKRLAVEEAGTYISSLTLVQNFRLVKDEITALASGVTQSQVLGVPSVVLRDGIIHVTVKARITVDTSILDQQIQEIMKEKGSLKNLEDSQQKVRELEDRLANLKSSEVKRLEELNAQALALERERERQRLALDEQVLKAQGELKKAELERLQKEKEMQERISKTITEQEKARKQEAEALAREQDRIRRASLENEQRWNELSRKAKLSQESWVAIDDSLSLKQAIEEAKQLKSEIANLKARLDLQFQQNKDNLKKAFELQIELSKPKLPSPLKEKDPFETTEEYNKRSVDYQAKVREAERQNRKVIEKLRSEENWRSTQATREYYEQTIKILDPFIKRLQTLQKRKFIIPGEIMTVELGDPEADKNRFPLFLKYRDQSWNSYWPYTDREKARDFWKTRSFLNAQALYQLEERDGVNQKITAAKVRHLGTNEERDIPLTEPQRFLELSMINNLASAEFPEIRKKEEEAKYLYGKGLSSRKYEDSFTGMQFIFVPGGCYQMGLSLNDAAHWDQSFGRAAMLHKVCVDDFFIGIYEVTQVQWETVMGSNPSEAARWRSAKGKEEVKNNPVEMVSWDDCQEFIYKLNLKTGENYRLPTEAEWEYAARSGGKDELYAGTSDEKKANEYGNGRYGSYHVGEMKPNGLGIYDMSGNVVEWCQDWYGEVYYRVSPQNNPMGPISGKERVYRGGAKNNTWIQGTVRLRFAAAPNEKGTLLGLRLMRVIKK